MIFDGSFSLYEGNAFAKFRRKSARAQLGDCIGVDIAEISRIFYILLDSLFQTTNRDSFSPFLLRLYLRRVVSEHQPRVRHIIYREATTQTVWGRNRDS